MPNEPGTYYIFTDGACKGNPGPGGWAAIIRFEGLDTELKGYAADTTNNKMEITAAIKGLEILPSGAKAVVCSDSSYLVNTMTKGWKKNTNKDLWDALDLLVSDIDVEWQWVKGHSGHSENERADKLASFMAESKGMSKLTHIDDKGDVSMVDVGSKGQTKREAIATGSVVMKPDTLALVLEGSIEKGSVFSVARIAGIMAAKKTSDLIPLCHQLPIDKVQIDLEADEHNSSIIITASASTTAKTGVEMEALTAVSIAALAIYDMCKGVDKFMHIEGVKLLKKTGGKSGDIVAF